MVGDVGTMREARKTAVSQLADKPRRHRHLPTGAVLIVPLLIFVALVFDLPLLTTVIWSLRGPKGDMLSVANYVQFFDSSIYLWVVWRTVKIAMLVSVACALLAYPLSYWMTGLSHRGQSVALAIIVMSFWVSILVRTYAWIVMLGNAGIVNRTLISAGWIERPIEFLYGELGVVIGMVNVLLPFMLLPLYASMRQIDPRLKQIALTMGATPWQFFWRVFWPMSIPSLAATMVLVFILSLGFYITPAILGGGKVPLIANMLDMLINQFPHWSLAAAMSVVLLILTLALYAAYQHLRARSAP